MYEKGMLPAEVSEELVVNFIEQKYGKAP